MGGSTLYVEAARVEAGEGKGSLRTTGASCLPAFYSSLLFACKRQSIARRASGRSIGVAERCSCSTGHGNSLGAYMLSGKVLQYRILGVGLFLVSF